MNNALWLNESLILLSFLWLCVKCLFLKERSLKLACVRNLTSCKVYLLCNVTSFKVRCIYNQLLFFQNCWSHFCKRSWRPEHTWLLPVLIHHFSESSCETLHRCEECSFQHGCFLLLLLSFLLPAFFLFTFLPPPHPPSPFQNYF